MRFIRFSRQLLLLVALLLSGFCGSALGDEIKFTPFASLKQEYNDNIFLDPHDRKSDFITTFSPGLEISDRNERLDAALSLRFNGILYAHNDNLNSIDQDYRGRLGYILTPRTKLSATAAYTLDSQPDRDIETTGLVLAAIKRHRQSYSFDAEYSLTEKTTLAINYGYEQDDYDSPQYTDLKWHNAGLSLIHDMDALLRNTKGSLNLGYSRYDFTGSGVDNYSLTIGIDKALTELWGFQAYAGARYTVSKFQAIQYEWYQPFPPIPYYIPIAVPVSETSREWGWVGQCAVTYRGEATNGTLSFSSDVKPSSGQNSGTTIRTGVTAEVRKRFSYELSGAMAVGYYHNKSNQGAFSGQRINEDTILATPSIRYEFNKDMYIEASYRYTKLYDNVYSTEADRNMVFVRFYMQQPMNW
ncbi:MAG: outer membrane beta-barrel protein [Geobacteraceae bacterium]|nr:outer membrane beta-barrel protein [Geobacteraceae bacterium]